MGNNNKEKEIHTPVDGASRIEERIMGEGNPCSLNLGDLFLLHEIELLNNSVLNRITEEDRARFWACGAGSQESRELLEKSGAGCLEAIQTRISRYNTVYQKLHNPNLDLSNYIREGPCPPPMEPVAYVRGLMLKMDADEKTVIDLVEEKAGQWMMDQPGAAWLLCVINGIPNALLHELV